jgi:hypothetical protein
MTQITEAPDLTAPEEAFALIEQGLSDLRGVNLVEASKMTDLLLDLRIIVERFANAN